MTSIKLKHVDRFVDRHGKVRHYFRRGKGKRTLLPGSPGSAVFMSAYQKALEGEAVKVGVPGRGGRGSFDHLAREYFASPDFLRIAPQTRVVYRGIIERFLINDSIGTRQVKEMTRRHVQMIMAKRAATPAAANNLLKMIRILVHFAIDNGWRTDDPTVRIKKFAEGEHHTWTDEEISQFQSHWAQGTKERLAHALLLYTGQRASDVAKMSSDDLTDGGIWVVQQKTKAKLMIPIHPELRAALVSSAGQAGPLLRTGQGRAFTSKGLSNYMADKIADSGLPQRCVTHGLRKAAARRLAEAGCSANEIAAITGHRKLEEIARYTRAAEQKLLARSAIERLTERSAAIEFPNLNPGLGKALEKDNEIKRVPTGWRSRQDSNLRPSA